ncbi:extracellular solute-binding protein [Actinoplanes sp. NPDC049599]|uniref:sugar ABC transporter substrate-binding protein n=1 Tax=Actinoplanes sp. NPDC049599 TaxID=3363903 RepID=UPI003790B035
MKPTRRALTPYRILAVVAAAALVCAGGCSGDSPSPAPGGAASTAAAASGAPARGDADLVIWTSDVAGRAVTPIAQEFGRRNGIKVAVQVIAADTAATAITANAAGNGPDILTLPNDFLGGALQNGAIKPLSLTAGDLSAYEKSAVASVSRNGQVWALPYAMENLVLYRNTDAAPAAPATVEELVSTGQAAVKKGTVDRALALPVGQEGDAYHMHPFFTSAGGWLFATDAQGQYDTGKVGIGTPESIAAARKIAALGKAGSGVLSQSVDGTNAIAQFTAGNAAYLVSGPWALADIRKSGVPYDITPIPPFKGGRPAAPFLGVQAFWIMSNAKNQGFAEEFVSRTMNTPAAMTSMYEQDPRPPVRADVLTAVSAKDADMAKLAAGAKNATLLPDFPFMAGVWPPLGQAYATIVGGADPAATMRKTGRTIQSVVAAR